MKIFLSYGHDSNAPHRHIRMLLTLNLMATFSFGVEEVGGMKIKTAVFHNAMRLTTPRKRVDWD